MAEVVFAVRVSDEVLASARRGGAGGQGQDHGGWEMVVCVTGSDPALGSWDIRSCVPLQRSSG